MNPARFEIPAARLSAFVEALRRINAKAARIGAPAIEIETGEEFPKTFTAVRRIWDGVRNSWTTDEVKVVRSAVPVILKGDGPRIPGWEVVGRVNIKKAYIRAGTDEVVGMPVEAYGGRSKAFVEKAVVASLDEKGRIPCHHCNTVRNRKEAFVVQSEAGDSVKVIGKECVRDFSGHDPAALARAYAGLAALRSEVEREFKSYSLVEEWDWKSFESAMQKEAVDLRAFLAAVADEVSANRWRRKREADGEPTTAEAALTAVRSGREPSDWAIDVADRVAGWIPNMGYRSDDLWKVKKIVTGAAGETVTTAEADLVSACVPAWACAEGVPLRGRFAGEKGERVELTIEVVSHRVDDQTFRDAYGRDMERDLHVWSFRTDDGALLTWSTTADHDFEKGDRLTSRGTVKAQRVSDYGTAVTEMSRMSGFKPASEDEPSDDDPLKGVAP